MKELKIIVLEDAPPLAALLTKVLLLRGSNVRVFFEPSFCPVANGHEAQCSKNTPCADVIISDHIMPNMTGADFFKLQKLRGCKIPDENKALITASAMYVDLKKAVEELGCHYIKKPFKVDKITKWIDKCAEGLT